MNLPQYNFQPMNNNQGANNMNNNQGVNNMNNLGGNPMRIGTSWSK